MYLYFVMEACCWLWQETKAGKSFRVDGILQTLDKNTNLCPANIAWILNCPVVQ